jgi:protein ImuB
MPITDPPPVGVGIAEGRFAASLAARQAVVVPSTETSDFLTEFPIEVLGQEDLVSVLMALGITTLGEFAALPHDSVLERFGRDGARAHVLARGMEEESLSASAPPQDLTVQTEFDPPAEQAETAAFAARVIVDDLITALSMHGLVCVRIRIEAETEHGEVLSRLWRSEHSFSADAIVQRLRWQLDGWLNGTVGGEQPTAGITLLRLVPDEIIRSSGYQLRFTGEQTDADLRAQRGLDRLRGILGPDAVFTGATVGGRSPLERVVLIPWGEPRPATPRHEPWPEHVPLPAAALIFPEPLPISVVNDRGEAIQVNIRGCLSDDPTQVCLDGRSWNQLCGWSGAWLSSERWWDPLRRRRISRFQFLLADNTAHLCFLEGGQWFLEATYD